MTPPLDKSSYEAPERAGGVAWVDAITAEIDAMSPMSEAQRKRTDQIGRLAGALCGAPFI